MNDFFLGKPNVAYTQWEIGLSQKNSVHMGGRYVCPYTLREIERCPYTLPVVAASPQDVFFLSETFSIEKA